MAEVLFVTMDCDHAHAESELPDQYSSHFIQSESAAATQAAGTLSRPRTGGKQARMKDSSKLYLTGRNHQRRISDSGG
jgi:hypothetical protein